MIIVNIKILWDKKYSIKNIVVLFQTLLNQNKLQNISFYYKKYTLQVCMYKKSFHPSYNLSFNLRLNLNQFHFWFLKIIF